MTTIAFFKTPELAQNKIQSLENSRLNGDNSTYSIANIDGVFAVQGVIIYSDELQKEMDSLFN